MLLDWLGGRHHLRVLNVNAVMENRLNSAEIWKRALGKLQVQLPRATFDTWLGDAYLLGEEDGLFIIGVPNAYTKGWLESKLHRRIHRVLTEVAHRQVEVRYVVSTGEKSQQKEQPDYDVPLLSVAAKSAKPEAARHFSDIVVSDFNRMAFASLTTVVKEFAATRQPSPYNPLVIYGGVGLGKTTLLRSAHGFLTDAGVNSLYITAEGFTNQLILAIRKKQTGEFRKRFRELDVLIADDLHFLAGKESSQEEFFHTVNSIAEQGGLVIASSLYHPYETVGLDEALSSMLSGGLTVYINAPNAAERAELLEHLFSRHSVDVGKHVLTAIAEAPITGIRELSGVVNYVVAHAKFLRQEITMEIVQRAIAPFVDGMSRRSMQPGAVLSAVSDFYGVPVGEIEGKSRRASVSKARQMAMYILREDMGLRLTRIGELLGGRSHATVKYACQKIARELEGNADIKRELLEIRSIIREAPAQAPLVTDVEREEVLREVADILG